MTVRSSDDDLAWLGNHGFTAPFSHRDDLRERIAHHLRENLPLQTEGIREALIAHLTDRLQVASNELDFVVENTALEGDRDYVLKALQFWDGRPGADPRADPAFDAFEPKYTSESFATWDRAVDHLKSIDDRFELFEKFAAIEDDFEPIERMIDDMVDAIDNAVQMEMDRIRGK
jgi:hypothetical protein